MDFTNRDLLEQRKNLSKIKERLKKNYIKLKKLEITIKNDEKIIDKFERVFGKIEEFQGVLLDIDIYDSLHGKAANIQSLADDNPRHAEIYKNAHNKKTWGGHLREFGKFSSEEVWLGANWPKFKDIIEVAKLYVAHGTIPKEYKKEF
ncbi:MAG: hypothetical protein PVG65_05210 [Candidatus Thorarchaeota archaeon]|jgi:hypothetical protein